MKRVLIILGKPGSGKDTQIGFLLKRRNLEVIRIGDLVRQKARIDAEIERDLEAGNLVDNEVVNEIIKEAINKSTPESHSISDGFPRDIEQAEWFEDYIAQESVKLEGVLLIDIDDKTALERLLARGRSDDDPETIRRRLKVFHTQTDDVIDYYQKNACLMKVDGSGEPEEVASRIKEALGW